MRTLYLKVTSAYFGWYVVAALFFISFLAVGGRQGFGVFVKTWEEEFATSVSLISTAAAIGWLVNGVSQPIYGSMIDRYGGRPVLLVSVAMLGLVTLAMSLMTNVYLLIFFYGFLASFASGGLAPATVASILARWFRIKRGLAISIALSGVSAGGMIVVPFMAYVMIYTSWQVSWAVIGAFILFLALPVTYLLVRSSPREMGLRQDGKTAVEDGDAETDGDTAGPLVTDNWKSSFSSAPVWQLSLGFFVCGITTASVSVHYVRWAQDQDITAAKAAIAFGFLSAINAFSVIGVGWLSDRFERRTLLGLVYFVRGLAFLCFLVFPPEIALWAFAIVGGASWLATVPLTTSITADVYGVRVLGTLTGLIFMSHQLGGAAAVLVFGLVFDAFDSYDPAFAGSVATLVFAGVISLTIKERRFSTRYQHDPDASPAAAD